MLNDFKVECKMGLIEKLRSMLGIQEKIATAAQTSLIRSKRNVELNRKWLTLYQPDFFGRAHHSPNKRWIVGCDDSDGNGRGGYREAGNGRVILVDYQADKVMHELTKFARPVDAVVSDVGSYIVHDSGFGDTLQGDVIAIDAAGEEMFRRHYSANVFNIGLSPCGRFAAVQTANAPNEDGNIFEVLDINLGVVIFTVPPATGWAKNYLFNMDNNGDLCEIVEHKDLGCFRYSATGDFQDSEAFQAAQLDKGDYATKLMAAQNLLKTDFAPDNAQKALSVADSALSEGANGRSDWAAVAHRVRGESYELLGQLTEALDAFEQALALNPKIGVQRRVTYLRKKLSARE